MSITASDFFSRPAAELPQRTEDAFFSAIRNRNKTFKRTNELRFANLDPALVEALRDCSPTGPAELLDIGISSGATTLDLQRALAEAGYFPRITGTDLAIHASIVRLGRRCSALVSKDGQPLQFDLAGIAVRPWSRRLDWITGMWLVRPLIRRWLTGRLERKAADRGCPVALVSPRLSDHSSISIVEDDILIRRKEFVGRYGLIRAANVLNRDYFPSEDLRRAIGNLQSYLASPGSLLLIVRTLGSGEHHGTLFVLDEQRRLRVRQRFGKGSEIEQLALQI